LLCRIIFVVVLLCNVIVVQGYNGMSQGGPSAADMGPGGPPEEKLDPEVEKRLEAAVKDLNNGRFNQGMEAFREIFSENPKSYTVAMAYGTNSKSFHQNEDALVAFQAAYNVQGWDPQVVDALAEAYFNVGDFETSLQLRLDFFKQIEQRMSMMGSDEAKRRFQASHIEGMHQDLANVVPMFLENTLRILTMTKGALHRHKGLFLEILSLARQMMDERSLTDSLVAFFDANDQADEASRIIKESDDGQEGSRGPGPASGGTNPRFKQFARQFWRGEVMDDTVAREYNPHKLGWDLTWEGEKETNNPAPWHPRKCSIDRRSSLTQEEFYKEYVATGKPVLVPGMVDEWPARTEWQRERMINKYGDVQVTVIRSSEITRRQYAESESYISSLGFQDEQSKASGGNMTFKEFVTVLDGLSLKETDPPYLFNYSPLPNLPEDYIHPYLFEPREDAFQTPYDMREEKSFFYVGKNSSGTYFHQHDHAWNTVLFGAKQWYLYPPMTGTPGPMYTSPKIWAEQYKNAVGDPPLECVQYPGELLFIPGSWSHLTLNYGDTVGIAMSCGGA